VIKVIRLHLLHVGKANGELPKVSSLGIIFDSERELKNRHWSQDLTGILHKQSVSGLRHVSGDKIKTEDI